MSQKVKWVLKTFSELNTDELYEILQKRQDVFILEQCCRYPDLDDKDKITLHLMGWIEDKLVAYSRIFPQDILFDDAASFGRVLTDSSYRKLGLGKNLVKQLIEVIENKLHSPKIRIEAQYYLVRFYEDFGFKAYGDTFMDAGVEHIMMVRDKA
ncbi:GNAT family N-acetyltransferase [Bacteroides propionicifaciens]|jgi:ElaA protein|uniref:GNAT family N-acetyltransferase n=1 Tax=Bacteroides propionicifaciens TaxID=392838 RepID=UPI00036DB63B|nr:GNAT family N-acetyltransferase [Bacteroides propionicifaciens]